MEPAKMQKVNSNGFYELDTVAGRIQHDQINSQTEPKRKPPSSNKQATKGKPSSTPNNQPKYQKKLPKRREEFPSLGVFSSIYDTIYMKVKPTDPDVKISDFSDTYIYLALRDIYPTFGGEYNMD
jgi:hypothetical protein